MAWPGLSAVGRRRQRPRRSQQQPMSECRGTRACATAGGGWGKDAERAPDRFPRRLPREPSCYCAAARQAGWLGSRAVGRPRLGRTERCCLPWSSQVPPDAASGSGQPRALPAPEAGVGRMPSPGLLPWPFPERLFGFQHHLELLFPPQHQDSKPPTSLAHAAPVSPILLAPAPRAVLTAQSQHDGPGLPGPRPAPAPGLLRLLRSSHEIQEPGRPPPCKAASRGGGKPQPQAQPQPQPQPQLLSPPAGHWAVVGSRPAGPWTAVS